MEMVEVIYVRSNQDIVELLIKINYLYALLIEEMEYFSLNLMKLEMMEIGYQGMDEAVLALLKLDLIVELAQDIQEHVLSFVEMELLNFKIMSNVMMET